MWPVKSRQMSKKVAQKDFASKMKDFDNLKRCLKCVVNLGKIIVATAFEILPKV